MQGHAWLVVDLLEAGDRAAVAAQMEAFDRRCARTLRQPLFTWVARIWETMLALLDGRLDDGPTALAAQALTSGIQPEGITASQYYAIQLLGDPSRAAADPRAGGRDAGAGGSPTRTGYAWRAAIAMVLADAGSHRRGAGRAGGTGRGGRGRTVSDAIPQRRRLADDRSRCSPSSPPNWSELGLERRGPLRRCSRRTREQCAS